MTDLAPPAPPKRWELVAYGFVRGFVDLVSRLLWRITVVHNGVDQVMVARPP